jgi:PAS domain S-box-containing protein
MEFMKMELSENAVCAFLDTLADGVIWLGEQQRVIFTNQQVGKLFGYPQQDLVGMPLENLLPTRVCQQCQEYFEACQRGADDPQALTTRLNFTGVKKNGQEFVAEATISRLQIQNGAILSLVIREIIPLDGANRSQHNHQQLLETIFNNAPDLLVLKDRDGKYLDVNPAFCAYLGKDHGEIIGKSDFDLFPRDEAIIYRQGDNLAHERMKTLSFIEPTSQNGEKCWMRVNKSPVTDEDGNFSGVLCVLSDITESVQDRRLLEIQRDLGQTLAGISNMKEALKECLKRTLEATHLDCGGLYLMNQATQDLELVISQGLSEQFVKAISHVPAGSPRWQLVKTGRPLYTIYEQIRTQNSPVDINEGLRAMCMIPLLHQGQVVACFNLASHVIDEVSPAGRMAAEAISAQIGNFLVRIQAEEDQLLAQRDLQALFDNLHDFIVVIDSQGCIQMVNEQANERLGYNRGELIGKNVLIMHPPEMHEEAQRIIDEMVNGRINTCPLSLITKSGEYIPVETKVEAGRWRNQPVLMGISRDISERLAAEHKLSYRSGFEDLLTRISTRFINLEGDEIDHEITRTLGEIGQFEKVDRAYIFIVDQQKGTMSHSHEWCQAGIEPQIENMQDIDMDVLPWWMAKLYCKEAIVVQRVADMPEEAAAEQEILQAQDIQSVSVFPLFANNELLGFVGFDAVRQEREWEQDCVAMLQQFGNIVSSLLERRRAEAALRQSEERTRALLHAIPDNMFRINSEGVILDCVITDDANLAISADQIIGIPVHRVLGSELGNIALEKIKTAVSSGQIQTMTYGINIQGRNEHFEARFVTSGENEVIAIVRNESERARLEQMKSDFINRATHDLRTPLTTIILMVRLLESPCTPEEYNEYWNILKDELERERVLIEDLLMVGRLESNRWAVRMQPVDPLVPLLNSIQSVEPQAQGKNIRIELESNGPRCEILGDASSLQQVFTNLLNNAIKFTPEGGRVSVRCALEDSRVCFHIQDNGIGIPEEDLPNLFSRFFRGRNAIDSEVPGSGIGLYIVKSIIEHLRGQIQVFSVIDQGTTFNFWFPILDDELYKISETTQAFDYEIS